MTSISRPTIQPMRIMISRLPIVAAMALLLAPAGLHAQSPSKVFVQLSAFSTGIMATDVTIGGVGFEGQLRSRTKYVPSVGLISIGVGGQFASHATSNDIGISIIGAFVEPRLLFPIGTGGFGPYISGRVALMRQTNDIATATTGPAFGGGVGVEFALRPSVTLDVGASALMQSFGESSAPSGRVFMSGSLTSYAIKAGLRFGF